MGVVYQARQKSLNRLVALKMILSGQFASESDVKRFYLEAEAAAKLDHPGIVPIYEVGSHDGHHFFSMKLIEGGSLAGKLAELGDRPNDLAGVVAAIAGSIHHAHQRGVLHRDLKPANILLDNEGHPLVSDLGLAKQIALDSDLTNTGTAVGTPAYMPPEQAAGGKEITTAADIYSIGAILYEGLTGRPPHQAETPVKTLLSALKGEVVAPREHNRRVDRTLERVCLKCLECDPSQRYASAAALADDLERWRRGEPVSVRSPSVGLAVTQVLQANLRSAVGAALTGIVAGIAFAWCMSKIHTQGDIRENPPLSIYESLPSPVPAGRSFVFMNEGLSADEVRLVSVLLIPVIIMLTGLLVAVTTRAKPGSEAFSFGLVASLFMAFCFFAFNLGFEAVADSHNDARDAITVLADAAFGEPERAEEARQALTREYPGVETLPRDKLANTLAYRIYYDGIYQIPRGMLVGVLMSVVLCVTPCLAGTTFASKLRDERPKWWTPAYFEFMVVMGVLVLALFVATLVMLGEANARIDTLADGVWVAGSYGLLVSLLAALYCRRLTWRSRILAYGFVVVWMFAPAYL
ncbi:Serine/threonine-protein kinase PrkC [Planctomycetes bacterium MalM25]|nr:Serine/threonine-protein kinase PrkC [Planctomycetes bacterium MalM25]